MVGSDVFKLMDLASDVANFGSVILKTDTSESLDISR
jgi:hypothetical protein